MHAHQRLAAVLRGYCHLGERHGLTFCLAPSRAVCVWSMAFTANALALSVKLVFCPACTQATARLRDSQSILHFCQATSCICLEHANKYF